MDDFKKQLEQAKLARMQGLQLGQTPPAPTSPAGQSKNRIEEALGRRPIDPPRPVAPVTSISSSPAAPRPISDIRPRSDIPLTPATPVQAAAPSAAPAALPKQDTNRETPGRGYGKFLKRFFLGLVILVILAAAGFFGRTYLKVRATRSVTASDTIAAVGKLVDLPANETPTVATITDLKPLAGEPFFKEAAMGDKVLIFATSSKAILYRPSTNKVIQVSPLNK